MPDWGLGKYELIGIEIEPVSERVVAMANPHRDEAVLDIACGTGNAALMAARFRSTVTALDQAPRLIEVARQRAADDGLDITFVVGDAQNLPFPDDSYDVAISIFGLIFAPDAEKAFAEVVRVLRPGGRAFITGWLPGGAIDAMGAVFMKHVNAASGQESPMARVHWNDETEVEEMAARHGATVVYHEGELGFSAGSPQDYLNRNLENHPMSIGMRPVLEEAGTYEAMKQEALAALEAGNEDPGAFRATSGYRIIEVRR